MKYLTFVDNINTFNLKNHQVLKLKFPSIKHWQWIFSRGGPTGPTLGSDRVKFKFWSCLIFSKLDQGFFYIATSSWLFSSAPLGIFTNVLIL